MTKSDRGEGGYLVSPDHFWTALNIPAEIDQNVVCVKVVKTFTYCHMEALKMKTIIAVWNKKKRIT